MGALFLFILCLGIVLACIALRNFRIFDDALCSVVKSKSDLDDWLKENRPELLRDIGPMHLEDVRLRLNEETGLDVKGSDLIAESWDLYLEAFKRQS